MAKSKLKLELERRVLDEAKLRSSLQENTARAQAANEKKFVPIETIAEKVREIGILAGVEPLREMNTFNRSFKTDDLDKITIAVANHLFGKFRVPTHLTNAWNGFTKTQTSHHTPTYDPYRRGVRNQQPTFQIPAPEKEMACIWYVVAASGGSLWKEQTRSYKRRQPKKGLKFDYETVDVPMFTRQENHAFLTCRIKGASFREAVIYAIAHDTTQDLGVINRICKSKLNEARINVGESFLSHCTKPLWREVIRFFCEHSLPVPEINDLLDYINHAITLQPDYSLKGRSLVSLKKNMEDWHWELARVKRMGNADWSAKKVPIDNEDFAINSTPGVTWTMEQITTSKALAAEGTSQRHCVYSYQDRCIQGTTAIWSLKRMRDNVQVKERALTLEMNVNSRSFVQIRGIANRQPRPDERAAVRYWAGKNNVNISQYSF